ncbi:MAG: peptidoglycan bridge formation glycyltransferase FemA/FemB family protein [Anaerolineales bacterium]|nr:peptidoglycan bridge formation glycyltransferase FemA/FemB family protein [Anaerolineales bacterium]
MMTMLPFNGGAAEWNTLISQLPSPHFLQTWEWSQVKAHYGWQPKPFVWKDGNNQVFAAAMILKRSIPIGGFSARLSVLYASKGPLLDWENQVHVKQVLDDLEQFARRQGAIFLKIDPDVLLAAGLPGDDDEENAGMGQWLQRVLSGRRWRFSEEQVQFRNSVLIDLTAASEDILARMKQKTRYNIRLAGRKGVVVRTGTEDDLAVLYRMYAETSVRDGFAIRDEKYYRTVWQSFMRSTDPKAEPLMAEVEGDPVAAIVVFYFAGRAYYVYGMSVDRHRDKMPAYVLQWEAIRRAKLAGCSDYDLWGAPEIFNERDPMWGVFRFKQGLGGRVMRTVGAWDYPARPFWYRVYTRILPQIMNFMRSIGRMKTKGIRRIDR